MSLVLSDIQLRFKKLGKFIYVSQLANGWIAPLKSAHAATVDQSSQNSSNTNVEFDVNDQIISTLGSSVKSTAVSLATIPTAELNAAQQFLIKFVGLVDLGLTGSPSVTTVGTALAANMTAVGAYVQPSGTNGANASGIAMYFASNWGIVLPQTGTTLIPDTYITASIL